MTTVIELEDIDIESLSSNTLDLVSQLAAEILRLSGNGFSFNDPFLLPKLRRQVKRIDEPELNALYRAYKRELRRCIKTGNFVLRPYRISVSNRNRYASASAAMELMAS